jgi:uncharacterized membrane protein
MTTNLEGTDMERDMNRRPLIAAGTLLGIGMGGFVDGIVFHQILQWHNMLSARRPPADLVSAKINMFWDGLFHAFTWAMTAIGLALLWRAGRRADVPWSAKTFVGALLLGWGLFNLVEGVIDHHILHIHHVIEGPGHLPWDIGFLASGAVFILVGGSIVRAGRDDAVPRGRSSP